MVGATKFMFGSRLCEGKVLLSLTSVVLNGNHFFRFVNKMLVYVIRFIQVIKNSKEKENGLQKKVLFQVLDKIVDLAPTYPQV